MALLIRDISECQLCGLIIRSDENAYLFPAFAENPADRFFAFSDAPFHERCLMGDENGRQAVAIVDDRESKIGPGKRKCEVCGQEVMDWTDYGMVDFICLPEMHPLGNFNYTHLHKSHASCWQRKDELLRQLASAHQVGLISKELANRILSNLGLSILALSEK